MTAAAATVRELGAGEVGRHLGTLDGWLLSGAALGVLHTWPQLYRSDGRGRFLGAFHGEELVSHLAWRPVVVHTGEGPLRGALLGSVATAPEWRGRGLASRLLQSAIATCRSEGVEAIYLWAEAEELYARAGFEPAGKQLQVVLRRSAGAPEPGVRLAEFADRARLLPLHQAKVVRVERDRKEMELLLSIPAMWTTLLETGDEVAAYACCGKGADLQGWWHEVGGSDDAVAALLRSSLALLDLDAAMVMLPADRTGVVERLGADVVDAMATPVAMRLALTCRGTAPFYIDGLDSV